MFTFGGILLLISTVIVFGADRLFKNGKITTLKSLLKVKVSGLALAVIGALLLFYGQ